MKKQLLVMFAAVAVAVTGIAAAAAAGGPSNHHKTTQQTAVMWHPQTGSGPVGPGAVAELVRSTKNVRYTLKTTDLVPGNAYTVWFVVVNDPASCDATPCTGPEIITEPPTDGQVTFGGDGAVAPANGKLTFKAKIDAGPLLDGWLDVQGLDDPLGAEIHLVLNDHGPALDEFMPGMVTTYRGGCSDESPFPPIFPPKALADGEVGPNTCMLYQAAVFAPPA